MAVADAVRLPLPDGATDLAIAFMSLHDFDDLRAAVAEVARVRFTVERAGLRMTYEGTHRPLSAYVDALEAARFVVEALREPVALGENGSPYVNFLHLQARLLEIPAEGS